MNIQALCFIEKKKKRLSVNTVARYSEEKHVSLWQCDGFTYISELIRFNQLSYESLAHHTAELRKANSWGEKSFSSQNNTLNISNNELFYLCTFQMIAVKVHSHFA